MADDPIEEQLRERLAYIERYPDDIEQSLSLARECAALRKLCREALDYFEPEGKPTEEAQRLFDGLKVAANGEEVRDA